MLMFWIALTALAFAAPPLALVMLVFAWAWSDRTGRRLLPGYRAWAEHRDEARWIAFRAAGRRAWRTTRRRLDAGQNGCAGSYKVEVRRR